MKASHPALAGSPARRAESMPSRFCRCTVCTHLFASCDLDRPFKASNGHVGSEVQRAQFRWTPQILGNTRAAARLSGGSVARTVFLQTIVNLFQPHKTTEGNPCPHLLSLSPEPSMPIVYPVHFRCKCNLRIN